MAKQRNAQRLRWILGLTGVAAVILISFTGYQALKARDALEVVAASFEEIADALRTGDETGARRSLEAAQEAASVASANTRGPGWWLTGRMPGVGDDISAVRTVASVTHVLATRVLPDVVQTSDTLDPAKLRPSGGSIALDPITEVAPAVVAADAEMQRQEDRVAAIDTEGLNPQLAEPVRLLQEKLGEAAALSTKASYAVRLLPSMLGAEEDRRYLVLFQNNAEVRATGGIPGAYATVSASGGALEMGTQGSASDLGRFPTPILPLTPEERALFSDRMGVFAQNLTFTPDFPRTAELAAAMWRRTAGEDVDGVMSVDPVALSYLLAGTGPVTLPTGEKLTSENVVDLLLSDIYYLEPDPADQDAFFAAAAKSVFDAVAAGTGDPAQVLEAIARGVSENRILVWSSRAEEQDLLERTQLAGRVPREPGGRPFVGVFLNDGTGAKMQYYLDHTVDVEPVACNPRGRQELEVTVRLRSSAPEDGRLLPEYVIGMAEDMDVEVGSMRVSVHAYAPIGGWIDESALDGEELPLSEVEHLGHPVGTRTVDIAPGQERVLTYTVMSGLDQERTPLVRVTPGIRSAGVGNVGDSRC